MYCKIPDYVTFGEHAYLPPHHLGHITVRSGCQLEIAYWFRAVFVTRARESTRARLLARRCQSQMTSTAFRLPRSETNANGSAFGAPTLSPCPACARCLWRATRSHR
jgi:hypothetical protein